MMAKIKLKTFDLQKIKIKILGEKKSQIIPGRELMLRHTDSRVEHGRALTRRHTDARVENDGKNKIESFDLQKNKIFG